jgi:hypothetical protein
MNSIRTWTTDWGEILLPPDFPPHIIRKNGWLDRRFKKERFKWQAFIDAETEKLRERWTNT